MREPIKVERPTTPEDAQQMAEWMGKLSHRNNVDPAVFNYPSTDVLKASNGVPLVYMPRQQVTMLESLAINPDAQKSDVALALRALIQVSEYEARMKGQGEEYFLCSDIATKEFCVRHGFDLMTPTVKLASSYESEGFPDINNSDMQLFRRKL